MDEHKAVCHGCFFCKTGKEDDVVRRFQTLLPRGRAITPTRSRYRRVKGTAIEEMVPLLPGYVFFELGKDETDDLQYALQSFFMADNVFKLLRYTDGSWQLHGHDDNFARMLFETGGNIGISQAYFDVGKRIRILSGFLKDYEGFIVRVNRKAKTVEVSVELQGEKVNMRLGYELVEPMDTKTDHKQC